MVNKCTYQMNFTIERKPFILASLDAGWEVFRSYDFSLTTISIAHRSGRSSIRLFHHVFLNHCSGQKMTLIIMVTLVQATEHPLRDFYIIQFIHQLLPLQILSRNLSSIQKINHPERFCHSDTQISLRPENSGAPQSEVQRQIIPNLHCHLHSLILFHVHNV